MPSYKKKNIHQNIVAGIYPYNEENSPYKWIIRYTDVLTDRRKSKKFVDRADAIEFQTTLAESAAHIMSTKLMPLNDMEKLNYTKLSGILSPLGITIEAALEELNSSLELIKEFNEPLLKVIDMCIQGNITEKVSYCLHPVIDAYIERSKRLERSENYIKQITTHLGSFKTLFTPDKLLEDVSANEIRKWHDSLKNNTKLADVSIHNKLHAVGTFFNYCTRMRYITINPMKQVAAHEVPFRDPLYYSVSEVKKILNGTWEKSSLRLFIILALFSGCRVSELLRLKWKHLSFEYKDIRIGAGLTKTERRRVIPLSENIDAWIEPYKQLRKKDEDYIFPWRENDTFVLHDLLNELFKRIGIKRIRNGFRHTAATYLLAYTNSAVKTSDLLGNSPAQLKSHYAGLALPSQAREFFSLQPED